MWFEHIDYRQGTLIFWAEAQELPSGDVELLDLAGIRVLTRADGNVWTEFEAGVGDPINVSIQLEPWSVGEAKFIALRWDSINELSGAQGGGAYRIMLHAADQRSGGQPNSFTPLPSAIESLAVGDVDGTFAVEQLVIYRRPLYVDDAILTGEDPFRDPVQGPTQLPHGGLDVLFATSCAESVGWSRTTEEEIKFLRAPIVFGEFRSIPPIERVFENGVMVGSQEHIVHPLVSGYSYTFSLLAHSSATATAVFKIFANNDGEAGDLLTQASVSGGSQQNPTLVVGSFTMPETHSSVLLVFINGRANGANAYFHSLEIRENLFNSAGFEESSDGLPVGEELEGWQTSDEIDVYRDTGSNGRVDSHSACFFGTGAASLSQDSISGRVDDKTFYAVGAEFKNISSASQDYVGAKIYTGNKSSFLDSDAWQPLRGPAMGAAEWSFSGMVSYHLLDEGSEVGLLNFGNDDETFKVDYCIDNVYLYPLKSVPAQAL